MITGTVKSQVDRIWDAFWSGGISNGLTVIEQITYLLFARRLDEIHTAKEAEANLLKKPIDAPIFSKTQQHLRWSKFKHLAPEAKYKVFRDEVFPFIKSLNREQDSAYARFMKDAVFVIPSPSLLDRVVDMLDAITKPEEREDVSPRFVVATQCLEVGADLDFDGMVC